MRRYGWLYFWEQTPDKPQVLRYKLCLEMKDSSESALIFIIFFALFINLFSRGAALFYMFFKQQYAVNSRKRFQFVILKIITLLLNSRVTTANLPNLPPHEPHPRHPVSILTSSSHQYFCKQLHHLILLSIFLHRNFLSFCIC